MIISELLYIVGTEAESIYYPIENRKISLFSVAVLIRQSHHLSRPMLRKKQYSLIVESHVPGIGNIPGKQADPNILWNIQVELPKPGIREFAA